MSDIIEDKLFAKFRLRPHDVLLRSGVTVCRLIISDFSQLYDSKFDTKPTLMVSLASRQDQAMDVRQKFQPHLSIPSAGVGFETVAPRFAGRSGWGGFCGRVSYVYYFRQMES